MNVRLLRHVFWKIHIHFILACLEELHDVDLVTSESEGSPLVSVFFHLASKNELNSSGE